MKLNSVLLSNFSAKKELKKQNKHISDLQNSKNSWLINNYPKSYYVNQLSFAAKKYSAKDLIEHIGEKNFPSSEIIGRLKVLDYTKNFSLYDIHMDYYKDLLDCSTLDEVKEKYPEFRDVVDAKEIDFKTLGGRSIFRKIAKGEVEGICIEDFSLELLKRYFGNLHSLKKKEFYFGIAIGDEVLDKLKIKKMSKNYTFCMLGSNPDFSAKMSDITQQTWSNDDGSRREKASRTAKAVFASEEVKNKSKEAMKEDDARKRRSDATKRRWDEDDGTMREKSSHTALTVLQSKEVREKSLVTRQTDEYRENARLATQRRWDEDDGTMREKSSHTASTVLQSKEVREKIFAIMQTDEYREKLSVAGKKFYEENPKYKEAQSLAYERHPEISEVMSQIAQKYPTLGIIIAKKKCGVKLDDGEDKILRVYYKECEKAMPGYKKIIGQEVHKILVEWGLIEE